MRSKKFKFRKRHIVYAVIATALIAVSAIKVNTPTSVVTPSPTPTPIVQTVGCHENNGLQDKLCTPGVANPDVSQANIQTTICVSGYTKTIRPPVSYTNQLKVQQIKQYGYSDTATTSYEEDHLIALEIGGDPSNAKNLWPEPYAGTNGAHRKDQVENYLHKQVCSGALSLSVAQAEIANDWVTTAVNAGL